MAWRVAAGYLGRTVSCLVGVGRRGWCVGGKRCVGDLLRPDDLALGWRVWRLGPVVSHCEIGRSCMWTLLWSWKMVSREVSEIKPR